MAFLDARVVAEIVPPRVVMGLVFGLVIRWMDPCWFRGARVLAGGPSPSYLSTRHAYITTFLCACVITCFLFDFPCVKLGRCRLQHHHLLLQQDVPEAGSESESEVKNGSDVW